MAKTKAVLKPPPGAVTHRFIKRLVKHGNDVVIYIPRDLQDLGWRTGKYITLLGVDNGKRIELIPLDHDDGTRNRVQGSYTSDRRATRAPA
jgi:hypothetical protein